MAWMKCILCHYMAWGKWPQAMAKKMQWKLWILWHNYLVFIHNTCKQNWVFLVHFFKSVVFLYGLLCRFCWTTSRRLQRSLKNKTLEVLGLKFNRDILKLPGLCVMSFSVMNAKWMCPQRKKLILRIDSAIFLVKPSSIMWFSSWMELQ